MTKKIFHAMGILFLSVAAVMAASPQRWIHVRVESARGVSGKMSFNVPIEMASAVWPSIPDEQHRHSKFNLQASVNGMDLHAMLTAVRNSPDNVFMTMERNDKEVSVAKAGRNMLIKIANKPGFDNHLGETIAIKVPITVVQAMLANNSDEVDVGAGIRALARYGDMEVTVNNEKETVHVWTDTRTNSD